MRLAAILMLAASLAVQTANAMAAVWKYDEAVEPMTDTKRGFASVASGNEALTFQCDGGDQHQLYAVIRLNEWVGKGSRPIRPLQYRVDSAAPKTITAYHNDKMAIVMNFAQDKDRDTFLADILPASRLVVRVLTYDNQYYTTTLDISGDKSAIARAARTCGDQTAPITATKP